MSHDRNCFQCGKPIKLVITENMGEWFNCEHCGERIMKVSEVVAQIKSNEEERVKRNLGFYDFKPKRG